MNMLSNIQAAALASVFLFGIVSHVDAGQLDRGVPPKPAPRDPIPITVPDAGNSLILLGAALAGIGGIRMWVRGRHDTTD